MNVLSYSWTWNNVYNQPSHFSLNRRIYSNLELWEYVNKSCYRFLSEWSAYTINWSVTWLFMDVTYTNFFTPAVNNWIIVDTALNQNQSINKSIYETTNQSIIVQRSTGLNGFARFLALRKEWSLSYHTCCVTWLGMTVWFVLFERSSRISHPPVLFKQGVQYPRDLQNEYI